MILIIQRWTQQRKNFSKNEPISFMAFKAKALKKSGNNLLERKKNFRKIGTDVLKSGIEALVLKQQRHTNTSIILNSFLRKAKN